MMHNQEFKLITEDMVRLRHEVMSRVRFVRRVRTVLSSPYLSLVFALIFVLCASIFVSLADVVHNIMVQSAWGGRLSYTYSSLMHAKIVVQILALLTSLSCAALFAKILFKLKTPAYYVGNFLVSLRPLKFFRS
jgi:uncharacterized membrane protein YjjP (DUF1212 family)